VTANHPLLPIADRIRMDRSRPKAVGRYRRARGFFIAIDGGFPTEARRLPMPAVEMEITVEFYSVSKQVTFVSTNDIIRLNKCHKVSPIVLAVSRDNHGILICPVGVTACS